MPAQGECLDTGGAKSKPAQGECLDTGGSIAMPAQGECLDTGGEKAMPAKWAQVLAIQQSGRLYNGIIQREKTK